MILARINLKGNELFYKSLNKIFFCIQNHSLSDNATTPGSCLPSTSSNEAPPPVLTWESFSADPLTFLRRATVSPPPATEVAPF